MPDGSVTRTIGKGPALPGMGAAAAGSTGQAPDLAGMLRGTQFTIVEDTVPRRTLAERGGADSSRVSVDFLMPMAGGEPQKARATFDTKEWLLRKLRLDAGPAGSTEMGYEYTRLGGHTMLARVNVVMGAAGFMNMEFGNYRKVKATARASFRVF